MDILDRLNYYFTIMFTRFTYCRKYGHMKLHGESYCENCGKDI